MAIVVFVVGTAVPTSPEQALARYAAECLDQYGHTTLIADTATDLADIVISVARRDGGFQLRNLYIPAEDLEVHGCGATLSPPADEALRRELAVSVDDALVSADEALVLHDGGAALLDVRSNGPHDQVVPSAIQVEKDRVIALGIARDLPIVVFCNGERGSIRVVRALQADGYTNVRHVRGGYTAIVASAQRRSYAHLG